MEKIGIIVLALIGVTLGGNIHHGAPAQAIVPAAPAVAVAAAPAQIAEPQYHSAPQQYAHEVPAAAIRNVETVDVTKTITPVVTKTTTRKTHSEPALSVGHVQGYSQASHGPAKVAPVQYNTQYTQYLNPTVGVNGPVTYSGPALGQGVAVQEGVQAVPVQHGIAAHPAHDGIHQVAVGGPEPVAYAGHGFVNAAQPAYNAAPVAFAAPPAQLNVAPAAYNGAFAGRIVNPAPLLGFNNLQLDSGLNNRIQQGQATQFFNGGNGLAQYQPAAYAAPAAAYAAPAAAYAAPAAAYAAPAAAYAAPAAAYAAPAAAYAAPAAPYAAPAAAIGIAAFDTSSLLTSAGYDSTHQNIHGASF